jgi:SAM-dependent methyltransferase
MLVREDEACAYPAVDGVPVLLAPEAAWADGSVTFDLRDPRYAEAYEEMGFYNAQARDLAQEIDRSGAARRLRRIRDTGADPARFPHPPELWLGSRYEPTAQAEAFAYLAPLAGKRVLQVGGGGTHALTFLLAGASEAWLATPIVHEVLFALELARRLNLTSRFRAVVGIAEELPFGDASFDAVYAQASVHHTVTELALPECARVLRPGGRFAAVETWRTPIYGIGIRIFGKTEPNVRCRPLTRARVAPLQTAFPRAGVVHHGALTRYPLVLLGRLGAPFGIRAAWKVSRADDVLGRLLPPLRALGSSVTLFGERAA